jgi:hypothetical protein
MAEHLPLITRGVEVGVGAAAATSLQPLLLRGRRECKGIVWWGDGLFPWSLRASTLHKFDFKEHLIISRHSASETFCFV